MPRFQFSLNNLLLWIAVIALAIGLVLTTRELSSRRRELEALQPLSVQEVARQFEARTSQGTLKVTVSDVRYSQADDAYRVKFSCVNSTDGASWTSDVKLEGDHFGSYSGMIRDGTYLTAIGTSSDGFYIVVEPPSTLGK